MQKQHHEQMYQFLQLERNKLEKQNADLVKELSVQREQVDRQNNYNKFIKLKLIESYIFSSLLKKKKL